MDRDVGGRKDEALGEVFIPISRFKEPKVKAWHVLRCFKSLGNGLFCFALFAANGVRVSSAFHLNDIRISNYTVFSTFSIFFVTVYLL